MYITGLSGKNVPIANENWNGKLKIENFWTDEKFFNRHELRTIPLSAVVASKFSCQPTRGFCMTRRQEIPSGLHVAAINYISGNESRKALLVMPHYFLRPTKYNDTRRLSRKFFRGNADTLRSKSILTATCSSAVRWSRNTGKSSKGKPLFTSS